MMRKKGAIISMLPWSLQEKVLWDFDDHKTADSLVSWLKAKVRVTSSWKVGGKEVHNLAEEHEDLRQEMLAIGIHLDDDQLFALANSRAGGHGGRPGGRPGPRAMPGSDRGPPRAPLGSDRGPPRSKADITCANCLGKGHTAMECKKEKVQRADRLCFQCGKPGHEARRCPEKSAKPAQSLEEAPREVPSLMIDEEGFTPIQRRKGREPDGSRWPVPQTPTLGSFIHPNMFEKLKSKDAEEVNEPEAQDLKNPPGPEDSDDEEEFCHSCESLVRTSIPQRCPECRRYNTLSKTSTCKVSTYGSTTSPPAPITTSIPGIPRSPGLSTSSSTSRTTSSPATSIPRTARALRTPPSSSRGSVSSMSENSSVSNSDDDKHNDTIHDHSHDHDHDHDHDHESSDHHIMPIEYEDDDDEMIMDL